MEENCRRLPYIGECDCGVIYSALQFNTFSWGGLWTGMSRESWRSMPYERSEMEKEGRARAGTGEVEHRREDIVIHTELIRVN